MAEGHHGLMCAAHGGICCHRGCCCECLAASGCTHSAGRRS
jgi:hypothetical protein